MGMRAGDLEDVVLSLVSLDEYQSKIDPQAIVLGLFVRYPDAANDLNRFIQKTPISIIDTEVSPAPDQQGYYMVFVEILNDDSIVDSIADLLNEVSPLCRITEWQFRIRGIDEVTEWDADVFSDHFAEVRRIEKRKSARQDIREFFKPSNLSDLNVGNQMITMKGMGYQETFEWLDFGDNIVPLNEGLGMMDGTTRRLAVMLGEGWAVDRIGKNIHLRNDKTSIVLRGR